MTFVMVPAFNTPTAQTATLDTSIHAGASAMPARTRLASLILLSLSPMAALSAAAPPGWDQITGDGIATHVSRLASDEFLGRGPASAGETTTLRYIEQVFAAAGLEPAVSGSYLQPLALLESTPDQASPLEIGGQSLRFAKDFVALSFAEGGKAVLRGSNLVFGGYGIVAPEMQWDDYAGVDLRGKTVLLLAGEPGSPAETDFFDGRALTVHGMRDTKLQAAAVRGAAAVFFIHTEAALGYGWSAIENGARTPRSALADGDDPRTKVRLSGMLSESAARNVLQAAGTDLDTLSRAAGNRGFKAQTLDASAGVTLQSKLRRSRTHNVIGRLPGRRATSEVVIYTAHWDHLGHNPELAGDDKIFNGAVDNATGTASLLQIAATFAALKERPERSILFIATGAEEQGLLGAEHYVRNPLHPLANTVGVINMDALFPFGRTASMTVTGMGSNEMEELLASAARRVGRSLLADGSPEHGAYFRSDHYPFVKHGVPALFAVGGLTLEQAEAGGELVAPWAAYMQRYHQPSDEYDPDSWDMGGIEQDARTFFEVGYRLANSEMWPNWRWNHALRAERDRQRNGR